MPYRSSRPYLSLLCANLILFQHCRVLAARRLRSKNAADLRLPRVCRARKLRNDAWMLVAAACCSLLRTRVVVTMQKRKVGLL